MAKTYIDLSNTVESWRIKTNSIVNEIGDLSSLTTPLGASNDSDLVTAILAVNTNIEGKLDSGDMPVSLILYDSTGAAVKTIKGVG